MPNLRKLLATTLTRGDLLHSVVHEAPADHVGALAFTDRLGALLWRLRSGNDASCFDQAALVLTKRCRKRHEGFRFVESVCRMALAEWVDDRCKACSGRGHTINHGVVRACSVCQSTGLRRHSDAGRMRALGLDKSAYMKAERKFAEAHMVIADADSRAWRGVAEQLERITGKAGVREKVLALHASGEIQ